jgi:hypothetical protein
MQTVFISFARGETSGGAAAWLQVVNLVFISSFSKPPMEPLSG